MSDTEKVRIAKKLPKQFTHPAGQRLVKLLRDGGVDDKTLLETVMKLETECEVCVKYKKASLRPAVCFPRASEFNKSVAIDLKSFSPYYMLHMIDHFTRYSSAIVIKDKHAGTIVDGILKSWIAIFGTPKKILSDNGGEFNNEEVIEMCEKMGIRVDCTAAESPWSNGVNERHNGLLGSMIEKLIADGIKLEHAVCWATSAKNALVNVSGYSPNQLVFGRNPNFPNILNSELPVLEPCRYQDKLYETMKALNEARKAYIHLEADERLKRAVKKKTRTQISSEPFELGSRVYFRRNNLWKGPGVVIGVDNKTVLVKQGGQMYRVPPCECKHLHGFQVTPENVVDQESSTTVTPPVTRRQARASGGTTVAVEECIESGNDSLTDSDASASPNMNTNADVGEISTDASDELRLE